MATKSCIQNLSQSSQELSQGSLSVNLTPATRKKNAQVYMSSPMSSPMLLEVNDDCSEKRARLKARLSDVAQKHMGSPASESRNKALSSTLSGWNATQITEHLHNCLQLSRDNKINVRNAFSLHLIDTMKDMVRKEKETNFQMAGSSIEAGAKIYAHRVDALHIQAFQVLNRISQLDKDGERATTDQGDGEGNLSNEDGTQTKKKSIRKKKKVIETDLKRINISDIEQSYEIDPLLQKLSKEGDASFGGLLLDSLRCAYDNGGLMLDVLSCTNPPSDHRLSNTPFTESECLNMTLADKELCPTFRQYQFNVVEQHPIFSALSSRDDELKFDPDRDMTAHNHDDFDVGPGDDSFGGDDVDPLRTEMEENFVDHASQSSAVHTTTACITDGTYSSLLSLVNRKGGDYSFFGRMKNMWAGPGHWKVRRQPFPGNKRSVEGAASTTKFKKIGQRAFVIDFDSDINFEKRFKRTRAATCVTKKTMERYKKSAVDLPKVSHYDSKDLINLFSRPSVFVVTKKSDASIAPDESMNKSAPYDYFNKTDVDNFCPDMSEGLADDGDDGGEQFSLTSGQPTVLDFDDTLIAQPALVNRIYLQYAKRPKKVDFKRIKYHMWNILTEDPNNKENIKNSAEDMSGKRVTKHGMPFTDLYARLPKLCPTHEAKDLSPPIAFVALLHMCNEKNLMLKNEKSFRDLEVFAGEE
ncbi:condensin complex subunit 2-like isoform X2 [Watersipora subatra]|uniref:condensin complex subunit 2-like isoform X2 n=1 Tax=Watersipora subatra TaxID=2589382 RepID=UPI00355B7A75